MLKIYKLSENIGETPEAIHYDYFDFRGGQLYYRVKNEPLMTEGKLRLVGMIADILGKNRLRNLGFDIAIHYDYFDFWRGGELYYRGKNEPLMTEGRLKSVGTKASRKSIESSRNSESILEFMMMQ